MPPTDAELQIARALADIQGHWYGHAPAGVYCKVTDAFVMVVLEETFSEAERLLISRGEPHGIQEMRRSFQSVMADEFTSIVEQHTGQQVRSFLSNTDLKENISVEVFVLAEAIEDMATYEQAIEEQDGQER